MNAYMYTLSFFAALFFTAYATNGDLGKVTAVLLAMVLTYILRNDIVNSFRKLRQSGGSPWN